MELIELRIRRSTFGKSEGQYIGHAEFGNKNGKVDLKLTPQHCEKIFAVCAEGIIEIAKEAAADLTCSVIEHQKIIEKLSTARKED